MTAAPTPLTPNPLVASELQLIEQLTAAYGRDIKVSSIQPMPIDSLIKLLGSDPPAIYVAKGPTAFVQGRMVLAWEVFLVVSTGAGQVAARYGVAGQDGLYSMETRLMQLACDSCITTDMAQLYLESLTYPSGEVAERLAESGVMAASGLLVGPGSPPAWVDPAELEPLRVIRANFDIAPLAPQEQREDLANDQDVPGLPDARDDIELQGDA